MAKNQDEIYHARANAALARGPADRPFYGSLGYNQVPADDRQGPGSATSDWVNIGGQGYQRFGDPSALDNKWVPPGTKEQLTYDPTYGYLLPESAYAQFQKPIHAMSAKDDKGSTAAFLSALAMFAAPVASSMGAIGPGSGVMGYQGTGGAFPAGAESAAYSGADLSNWFSQPGAPVSEGVPSWMNEAGSTGGASGGGEVAGGTESVGMPDFLADDMEVQKYIQDTGGMTVGGPSAEAAAAKIGTSAIGRLFKGEATADDYLKLAGTAGGSLLGYLGSEAQANASSATADKYLALGAPFRGRLAESYAPGFDLTKSDPAFQGAIDQSSESVLRKLSAEVGNPYENSGARSEAQRYVLSSTILPQLNTYRSQLGSFGQLGVNTAGTADLTGASTAGGGLEALGYGLAGLTAPDNILEALLQKLQGGTLGNWKTLAG